VKPLVHHVRRLNVATSLVFGLFGRELHLFPDRLHRALRPGGGETDIVAIHTGGAAIERLVSGVAHEAQANVIASADVRHRATQALRVPGGMIARPFSSCRGAIVPQGGS
jgi:hypothetical protein